MYEINRFHYCALATWQFAIFLGGQNIFGIFSNHVPQWKCGDGPPTRDCDVYRSCPKHNLTFHEPVFLSAAMEFDWVCGSSVYYQSLFSQIQYFGVLIGTVLFGTLSDTFGRKPIGILVLTSAIFATFSSGLARTPLTLFSLRFILGLSLGGIFVVICTWIMELLLPQQRMVLRGFFNWGWTRILLTVICMLIPQWRYASFACAAFALPALFLIIFVIPESPIWLHSKNYKQRMIESQDKIRRISKVPQPPLEHKIVKPKSIVQILRTKGLFKKLSTLWVMWFIAAVCAFANDLNSSKIAGDLYMNQILFGVILVFSKMLLLFVDTKYENFKRRTLHQGAQLCVLVCFIALTAFILYDYHGIGFLLVNILGTAFIEYTWDACYLCAIESMETSCRASATGTCSLMARVGSIIAPFLNYANTWWPPAVYITVVILGSINFLVSYFFLQETKNVNLDDVHVDDSEVTAEQIPLNVQKVRD